MKEKLLRYGIAAVGPIGSAGAQFALSIILMRLLPQAQFGTFSFLLVVSQLSWGLWSALFCAPMPMLMNRGTQEDRLTLSNSLFATNLACSFLALLLFLALGLALGTSLVTALIFAVYAQIALLRWFARAYAYANGFPLRTTASDLLYGAILLGGVGVATLLHVASLEIAYIALLVSAAIGLLPFGRAYLSRQFVHVAPSAIPAYGRVWREHSGWSLSGVLTTEATSNIHAYLITLLHGAAAFAPIAASALVIRPIAVLMNAMVDFERAQMARQIGEGDYDSVLGSIRIFRFALAMVWVAAAIGVAGLFAYNPHLLYPKHYDLAFLMAGTMLWMAVAGVRLARTPENALLQAGGAFRPLAHASFVSSGFSIVSVIVLLTFGGPLWSIGGVLMGETAFCAWTWLAARRWLVRHRAADAPAMEPAA
jgi:O-antigen/teichoic acid export membrane protein